MITSNIKTLINLAEKNKAYWMELEQHSFYNPTTIELNSPIEINANKYCSLTGSLGVLTCAFVEKNIDGHSIKITEIKGWELLLNTGINVNSHMTEFMQGTKVFIPFNKVVEIKVVDRNNTNQIIMKKNKHYD